jgi:ATP-dependent DNA helicase RecG
LELTARIPFDDRINQLASLDNLSLARIQEYLKEVMSGLYAESSNMTFPDLCKQMKIAKGPDEFLRPTNCGLLLFSEQPEKFFPGAKIEIIIHKVNTGKNYTEKIFASPIHSQLRNALNYFKTYIIEEHILKTSNRPEAIRFFNYPFEALEEALVNAAYHKSYERDNSIEVQIFPDKIEILNFPGPLPPIDNNMLQKERIIARDYRNRKLGDFFKELRLTEGRGTGIPLIRRSLEENGSPPPVFETDGDRNYFLCILKKHTLFPQKDNVRAKDGAKDKELIINSLRDIDKYLRSINDQRWAKDKKVLLAVLDNKIIHILSACSTPKTREEIFNHIGLFNNSKNFNRHLKPLIDLGWIQLTIPDKPTSKNQKYVTADIAQRLVNNGKTGIERIPVASSNITSVGYDDNKKILEIEFHHGDIYQYIDVPKRIFEKLVNASSISAYFFHNIRDEYKYQKI